VSRSSRITLSCLAGVVVIGASARTFARTGYNTNARAATLSRNGGKPGSQDQAHVRRVLVDKGGAVYEGNPSPNGRRFVMTDWDTCDLVIRHLDSDSVQPLGLTNGKSCDEWGEFGVVSPDGRRVAFQWHVGGNNTGGDELRVVSIDSAAPDVLVAPADDQVISPQDWTPDGKYVAFVVAHRKEPPRLALVAIDGGPPRILRTFPSWHHPHSIRMRVSPDGLYIAYSFPSPENDGRHDVHLLSVSDGRDIPIVRHVAADEVTGWADATHLILASDRGGSPGIWSLGIAKGKPVGEPRLIRGDMWGMDPLRLGAPGELFYIVTSGDGDIYTGTIDLKTGNVQTGSTGITEKPGMPHGYPAWSPDGNYVAFTTAVNPRPGEANQVVTIRAIEGEDRREFRPGLQYIAALTWIPNARALALRVHDPVRGVDELVRLDLATGDVTPLVRPFRGVPVFSPDGRWMYYMASESDARMLKASDPSRLVGRNLTTGEERVIYTPPAGYVVFGSPAVAPLYCVTEDGRSIIFPIVDDEGRPTKMRMIRAPVEGGPPLDVIAPADGSTSLFRILGQDAQGHVIFIGGAPRAQTFSLWRAPLGGGTAELIAPPRPEFGTIILSPDSRHVAFPKGTINPPELWVLEAAGLSGDPGAVRSAPGN
jgi:dipeptidyl aminopeptidase/acylaminoacyl peptidase